jgi:fermentation-respiration switch protein FrsA (DUF1100 family)
VHGKAALMLRMLLLSIAIAYLALLVTLFLAQRYFIYPAPKGESLVPAGFEQITYETSDGLTLRSGYKPARDRRPTIVYFHGNGADWQSSVVATDRLTPAGYGVLAAEYRGYRDNPGSPNEQGFYRDGRAALNWLASHGVKMSDIVIVGNSIGGGVATQLASEAEPRALVLISPFANLPQVASEKLWWLPIRQMLKDRYTNHEKIGSIKAPIMLLHGDMDKVIPHHHSQLLAEINPAATLVIFPGAGHELAWRDEAERAVLDFLENFDAADRPE